MTFTHKRSHGGKSSPQLVNEAVALHKRLGDVLIMNLGADKRRWEQIKRLHRRAFTRYLRREVRLTIQEGR